MHVGRKLLCCGNATNLYDDMKSTKKKERRSSDRQPLAKKLQLETLKQTFSFILLPNTQKRSHSSAPKIPLSK